MQESIAEDGEYTHPVIGSGSGGLSRARWGGTLLGKLQQGRR